MTLQRDYEATYAAFGMSEALGLLAGSPEDGWNAAIECCDRWCGENRVALRWAGENGERLDFTFEQLRDESSRLANLMTSVGICAGDRVAGLLPRTPLLLITILATWRVGAVYQPLFTAFGPKAIDHRLTTSGAKLVVTDPANRGKLSVGDAKHIVFLSEPSVDAEETDVVLATEFSSQSATFLPVARQLHEPFLLMFTSGTTGAAKPLIVPLRAIAAFTAYMRDAVDLRADDEFWNIADPGWAYGLYYAVTGPLALGHATLFYSGGFSAQSAVAVIREFGISNLAGAPTAFRQLVTAGSEVVAPIIGQLRAVSSAGEPLNPDIAAWFDVILKAPIRDHYGQTELGMVVCNHHALVHPVQPGSAGFAVPGHRIVVLDEDDNELPPQIPGILAVDTKNSPQYWFAGYDRPDEASPTRYYRSGDTVELNPNGSISFVGRADDVITSSGYRIGPFDVESALVEHPAVAEAAVIGKPDPERTEIVKAFVVLEASTIGNAELKRTLQAYVKTRLSAHAYPREIAFVDQLPKTPSGKVQRFLLRAQEASLAAD